MLLHQKREKRKQKIVIKVGDLSLLSPSRNSNVMVCAQLRSCISFTYINAASCSRLPSRLVSSGSVSPARQLLCFPCVFRGMLRIFSSNFITIFTWHICSHFDLAKAKIYLAAAAPATIITTADAASLPLSFDLVLCVLWACQCVVPRASCVIKTH